MMRRSVTRANKRSTLLLQELESERVEELEKEKLDLEIAVVGLQGENEDLQEEIQKLTSLLQKQVDSKSDGTHEWHA
jgi:chaperonin cofactor prefoldin